MQQTIQKQTHKPKQKNAWKYILSVIIILIYILPIYVLVNMAFKHPTDLGSRLLPPTYFDISNFTSIIESGSFDVEVAPMSAGWMPKQDFSDRATYDCYYSYELVDSQGSPVGEGTVFFCAPKHFRFVDPKLSVSVKGDEITVTAGAYARSVEIQAGADTVLSDNYFDMDGGSKTVKVVRGTVSDVSVRSVYDIR